MAFDPPHLAHHSISHQRPYGMRHLKLALWKAPKALLYRFINPHGSTYIDNNIDEIRG